MPTTETPRVSVLPLPTPDYTSLLLRAVVRELEIRHPRTRGFEQDFRRAFAEAAHAVDMYHQQNPSRYNYFFGKVRERVDAELSTVRQQNRKPLRPIATEEQLALEFACPATMFPEQRAPACLFH